MIWPIAAFMQRHSGAILVVLGIGTAFVYHRVELNAAHRSGYAAAEAGMTQRVAAANAATAALEERQREQSKKAAVAWEKDRADLESQVARLLSRPGRPIRVCRDSAGGRELPGAAGAAGSADGQPAASIDAVRVGIDIGSAGVVLAAECERYRLQLSALQEWVSASR